MDCQSFFQAQEEWFSVEVPVHDGKLREHIWANVTVDIENNGRQVLLGPEAARPRLPLSYSSCCTHCQKRNLSVQSLLLLGAGAGIAQRERTPKPDFLDLYPSSAIFLTLLPWASY